MKSYKDITADVLERRANYIKKKKRRNTALVSATAFLCLLLVVAFSIQPVSMYLNSKKVMNLPKTVASYDQLYSAISSIIKEKTGYRGGLKTSNEADFLSGEGAIAPGAPQDSSSETPKDYSDTNLQVVGVQEADIVKTDGDYIYAISGQSLYIVKVDGEDLELAAKIDGWDENQSVYFEMYITKNRLIILKYYNDYTDGGYAMPEIGYDGMYWGWTNNKIGVDIFDITDRNEPKHLNTIGQTGAYTSSRMIGDVLYLVSSQYVYDADKSKPETYIPKTFDKNGEYLLNPKDITLNTEYLDSYSTQYLVLSGVDTANECEIVSSKAMFGFGNNIYASMENIYVAAYTQIKEGDIVTSATRLFKFGIDKGNIEQKAEGIVKGNILNQFSMDEYEGNFRIVTTQYSYKEYTSGKGDDIAVSPVGNDNQSNALYVLDSDLKVIGKIEDLAKGERVYSVRFTGELAYFVTFRQVDPLFAVDLSDATKPTLLSALKIPGFSEYLHPFADGLLFGLGRDGDMDGNVGGLKLSMFDVTDPKNVSEKHKLVIKDVWYSEASYNHKAILINAQKNIIAFPADDSSYLVYSYSKEAGFKQEARIRLDSQWFNYGYGYTMRGLYIDEFLYISCGNTLSVFDMNGFELVTTFVYDENLGGGNTLPSGGTGSGSDGGNTGSTEPGQDVTEPMPTMWSFEAKLLRFDGDVLLVSTDTYKEVYISTVPETKIIDANGNAIALSDIPNDAKLTIEVTDFAVSSDNIAKGIAIAIIVL